MTIVTTTRTRQQTLNQRRSSLQIVASSIPVDNATNSPIDSSHTTLYNTSLPSLRLDTIRTSILDALCVSTLYLIHFIYIAYIAQQTLRTCIVHGWRRYRFQLQYNNNNSSLLSSNKQKDMITLLKYDRSQLTKIPHHVGITVSSELVFERSEEDWNRIIFDLCQVCCWAWEMGIKEVSVLDASGVLKNMAIDIYKQQSMTLHEWKQQHSSSSCLMQNDFRFKILSLEDTQTQIVQATQKVFKHIQYNKTTSIDINLVNEFMQEDLSDPDLMIVYDGLPHQYVSIDGYSPWHIRLTEFVNATAYHRLDYILFSSCLYQYSKVEQRFGH
ncbi:uncharacterized protein BX664DRAFT_342376 [Halteromyces radiatus]|uniref:uncharacterized protein n=1 Tax=Halteromyces radiatus TaxID=101107 RepID=UPI00221F9FB3|nr:uncharacterized protein BX664DRAFT_342376 [Halteromyces radiatus]KAI8078642.1 hypothetical protein BX664DRAFT_342376 [Halteromyces radiatus]